MGRHGWQGRRGECARSCGCYFTLLIILPIWSPINIQAIPPTPRLSGSGRVLPPCFVVPVEREWHRGGERYYRANCRLFEVPLTYPSTDSFNSNSPTFTSVLHWVNQPEGDITRPYGTICPAHCTFERVRGPQQAQGTHARRDHVSMHEQTYGRIRQESTTIINSYRWPRSELCVPKRKIRASSERKKGKGTCDLILPGNGPIHRPGHLACVHVLVSVPSHDECETASPEYRYPLPRLNCASIL